MLCRGLREEEISQSGSEEQSEVGVEITQWQSLRTPKTWSTHTKKHRNRNLCKAMNNTLQPSIGSIQNRCITITMQRGEK